MPVLVVAVLLMACSRPAPVGSQWNGRQAGNALNAQEPSEMREPRRHKLFITYSDTLQDKGNVLHFFDQRDDVIRFREVWLHEGVSQESIIREGDELITRLFEPAPLFLLVERVATNIQGTVIIRAVLPGEESRMIIATTGNRSLAQMLRADKDRFYQVISEPGSGKHYLLEMRASDRDILEGGGPLVPPDNNR